MRPKAGETVLVNAAAGAVGSLVVQLAKMSGEEAVYDGGGKVTHTDVQSTRCSDVTLFTELRSPTPTTMFTLHGKQLMSRYVTI